MLILDFCATLSIIHLILICQITGIPTSWQWWVLKLSTFTAQALASRFFLSQLVLPIRRLSIARPPGMQRMSHIV